MVLLDCVSVMSDYKYMYTYVSAHHRDIQFEAITTK